jgi:hypothetical protein
MKSLTYLIALLCFAAGATATSVLPPTFSELVDGSMLVFRARVTAVETVWSGEGAERHLATRVTFAVERSLKGGVPAELSLEFMGGARDGHRLEIAGLPKFAVGERGVFFVENRDGQLCPLMRLGHGRYRVAKDAATGSEHVARDDHSPLRDLSEVASPLTESPRRAAAPREEGMALEDFERAVTTQVERSPAGRQGAR